MLVLAAMGTELRPLARALSLRRGQVGGVAVRVGASKSGMPIVAKVVGIGPSVSRRSTERLLDAVGPDQRVLVIGVAGGVDPTLSIGDLLTPAVVVDQATGIEFFPRHPPGVISGGVLMTCESLASGPANLRELRAAGVTAVDMETAAIAAVCGVRGVPWSVFRAVSDTVADGLVDEAVLELTRPEGSTNPWAVARYLARRPWAVPRLARLGRGTSRAVGAVTEAALRSPSLADHGI